MSTNYRICPICKQSLPLTLEFWHRNSQNKAGFSGYCRACMSKKNKQYRETHPKHSTFYKYQNLDQYRESEQQYYQENREDILKKAKERRDSDVEENRRYQRGYYHANKTQILDNRKQKRQQKPQSDIPKQEEIPSRPGFVYLLQSPSGIYKIGRTKNPENRIKTFSVKLPFETEYICLISCDNMYVLEKQLHNKFKDKRMNGEWFRLNQEDIDYIKGLRAGE